MTVTSENPVFPAAAVNALKQWLRIRGGDEDALLADALRAALAHCESFVGGPLIVRTFTETLPITREWQALSLAPVVAIGPLTGLPAEGAPFELPVADYAIDIDARGLGRVRIERPGAAGRVSADYLAGLASDWTLLEEPLRQAAIRFAAYLFEARGAPDRDAIPSAVAALLRPYRRMRLA